jgi:RNA polymerase sigma factor (sigma-70 family)
MQTTTGKTRIRETYQHHTENALVQLFKEGDDSAFEVLINRHKDKVFASILILVKERDLAEDLFQDVFIKVIDAIRSGNYNPENKFLSWIIRIAHNHCIDHFRAVKRGAASYCARPEEVAYLADDRTADSDIVEGEVHEKLQQLINKLPFDQREVLMMRHYEKLTFKEIAEIRGCSINTALGQMRYALINIRRTPKILEWLQS